MTEAQTLFSVFYAVLYGALLSGMSSFRAFPWGLWQEPERKEQQRLLARLFISIIVINIIPFILFAIGYQIFSAIDGALGFGLALLVAMSALSVYSAYRIYHLILTVFHESLYSEEEWKEIITTRRFRGSVSGYFIASVLYGLPLLIAWLVVRG